MERTLKLFAWNEAGKLKATVKAVSKNRLDRVRPESIRGHLPGFDYFRESELSGILCGWHAACDAIGWTYKSEWTGRWERMPAFSGDIPV